MRIHVIEEPEEWSLVRVQTFEEIQELLGDVLAQTEHAIEL